MQIKNAKFEIDVEICLFFGANLCKQKCNFQRGYNELIMRNFSLMQPGPGENYIS